MTGERSFYERIERARQILNTTFSFDDNPKNTLSFKTTKIPRSVASRVDIAVSMYLEGEDSPIERKFSCPDFSLSGGFLVMEDRGESGFSVTTFAGELSFERRVDNGYWFKLDSLPGDYHMIDQPFFEPFAPPSP